MPIPPWICSASRVTISVEQDPSSLARPGSVRVPPRSKVRPAELPASGQARCHLVELFQLAGVVGRVSTKHFPIIGLLDLIS
jgi:hypothetical protein